MVDTRNALQGSSQRPIFDRDALRSCHAYSSRHRRRRVHRVASRGPAPGGRGRRAGSGQPLDRLVGESPGGGGETTRERRRGSTAVASRSSSGDIRDRELLRKALRSVKYVFHMAALPASAASMADPGDIHAVNVEGTLNLLHGALTEGVWRVVLASCASVYGAPGSVPVSEDAPCGRPASLPRPRSRRRRTVEPSMPGTSSTP